MTHEDVWRAIEREGQPRWPSTNSISKILSSTGASIQEFTKFIDNPGPERAG